MARASGYRAERVTLPHESGEWMVFRCLSFGALEEARRIGLEKASVLLRSIGDLANQDGRGEAVPDRLAGYDVGTLLKFGLAEWSYQGPVDPTDLDERTARWAAREILRISDPEEAEVKKDSSRSIAISPATVG